MFWKVLVGSTALALITAAPAYAVSPPQIPVAGVIQAVPGHPHAVPAAVLMSQVVTRTNQLRHQFGCDQLTVDHDLITASVRESFDMAVTGRFSHIGRDGSTFVSRAREAGYAQPAGENIAWGYRTADDVILAWMNSPHHRENMLNCDARAMGTGVVYTRGGTPYFTEVFGF